MEELCYKTQSADEEAIYTHLRACQDLFSPPLNTRVDFSAYAKKIFVKSVTFEAWSRTTLIGLLACYLNDFENHVGYITHLGVLENFIGMGIGSKLIHMCLQYARQRSFQEMRLEVHEDNTAAIGLYRKFDFQTAEHKDHALIMRHDIRPL